MLFIATDWATISSLATGAGTLVLAVATFAAVRSSNRSARLAEIALQEQRRPILTPSRLSDPAQKLMFADEHWVNTPGGQGTAEHVEGVVYLSLSLRNVGSGIAVCQAWTVLPRLALTGSMPDHVPLDQLRIQGRDFYIPPGDIGMWQGALRDPSDPLRAAVAAAIDAGERITLELLYSDQTGDQRTVTRFALLPKADVWITSMSRHWHLDWEGPRSQSGIAAATQSVNREIELARQARANDTADTELELEPLQ